MTRNLTIAFLFFFLFIQAYAQNASVDRVYTLAGDVATKASVNEKLKLQLKETDTDSLWVYVKGLKVSQVETIKDEPGWYIFSLNAITVEGDTLTAILNPTGKSELMAPISIGKDYNSRKVIAGRFTIVFDRAKQFRRIFSGSTAVILFLIAFTILFRNKGKILRDVGTSLEAPPYSLARTQMAYWTIIVLIAIVVVWWHTGNLIEINGDVLALLGISAGTTFGAHLIDNDDISNKAIKRHQEDNDSKSFLLNILSDQNGLSVHRLQYLLFSIAIGCYFLYQVFNKFQIPDLDSNLMLLMGISSGTYLAIKKGENKTSFAPANPGVDENKDTPAPKST